MEKNLIALASISVGVWATFFISRYYYRRSVDKELTPFIQMQSNVLSRIDSEVKSDLHIKYKEIKVESLQQVQFLIANTGERAIRDIIKPLNLHLPNDVEVMDASILYVSPTDREVSLEVSEKKNSINFNFSLLNKDEYFIFKLLLNGAPKKTDLKFTITAAYLPPTLVTKRFTIDQIEQEGKNEKANPFVVGVFIAGLSVSVFVVALCLGILAHYIDTEAFPIIQSEAWKWANSIPFVLIASFVGYVLSGMLHLVGAMIIIVSIFGSFELPKNKKFKLPKEFDARGDFRDVAEMVLNDRAVANKIRQQSADPSAD
tara:strand:+ start:693 stop:1640 length:948 start_codon:yes stop_codon:yes gene_type:complete